MNISSDQLGSTTNSVSHSNDKTKRLFQNRNMFTGQMIKVKADIASQDTISSKIMSQIKAVDSTKLAQKINAFKDKIDALGLENLDVDSMSRHELEFKMIEILEIVGALKESDDGDINLTGMSDNELKDRITGFFDSLKKKHG